MARTLPPARYSSWQAINVAITLGLRALDEVRALAAAKVPVVNTGVDRGEVARMIAEAIAGMPQPKRGSEGPPGKLPVAKQWREKVYYEGDVATHGGATYQAIRDTGREPPHDDWALIAARGEDAPVGEVCGLYDETRKYCKFDLVASNGSEWRAKYDDPGPIPGNGWELAAKVGKPGRPGDAGPKGDPGIIGKSGPPGPTISEWRKDGYRAIPIMSDGSIGPALDVREFFERYHGELA